MMVFIQISDRSYVPEKSTVLVNVTFKIQQSTIIRSGKAPSLAYDELHRRVRSEYVRLIVKYGL